MTTRIDNLDRKLIEALYNYGHFQNPLNENGHGIRRRDLSGLTIDHPVVKKALLSYQQIAGLSVDGNAGPFTIHSLLETQRCGYPDYGFMAENGEVVAAATGSGGWPHSCRIDHRGVHAITISWDFSRRPSFLDQVFDRIWDEVVAMYVDIGLLLIREDGNPRANLQASFQSLQGSTIGLAIVPGGPPSCGTSIWNKYDPDYHPRNIINEYRTLIAHEIGHNQRLEHTRGGIMNPGIIEGLAGTWRNDPSLRQLIRQYGGEPVGGPKEDEKLKELVLVGDQGSKQTFSLGLSPVPFENGRKFLLEAMK